MVSSNNWLVWLISSDSTGQNVLVLKFPTTNMLMAYGDLSHLKSWFSES